MAASRFICGVFFQCLCLAWEGNFSDGREKTPPLMLFGPMSALYSVIAMWVSKSISSPEMEVSECFYVTSDN